MDEPKPSLKFRYDMFMLRHKKEFLRAVIIILVIVVIILLAVFLSEQKWELNMGSESGQPTQPAQPAEQPAQAPQPFWPWEQPAQTTQPSEPAQVSACPDSSIEITDLRVDDGLARVIVKNTGTRSIKFSSVVFYDKYGNAIPTDTSLQRTYEYLNVDAFTFTDPRVSCNTFSKVVAETDCRGVTATFDSVPSGC